MEIETGLQQLYGLQEERELYILKISEPLTAQTEHPQSHISNRSSDVSSAVNDAGHPTPASLEVDLAHYKELFTKLRFSYIEQTTKEKFLRAVVGDPPLYVTAPENVALESHLSSVKANLKAQKTEVADIVTELERQSRELSRRHSKVEQQTEQMRALPEDMVRLKETINVLQKAQAPVSQNPMMNLPLPKVLELIAQRKAEVDRLDSLLLEYENTVESKDTELKRLQMELQPLEAQNASATAAAKDARRRRDEGIGGIGDDLEERGRWLRGVETTMKGILESDD